MPASAAAAAVTRGAQELPCTALGKPQSGAGTTCGVLAVPPPAWALRWGSACPGKHSNSSQLWAGLFGHHAGFKGVGQLRACAGAW